MSITIDSMIDTPPQQAARQPLNRRFQTPSRLIPRWNHAPGSRLIPRWTRLRLAQAARVGDDAADSAYRRQNVPAGPGFVYRIIGFLEQRPGSAGDAAPRTLVRVFEFLPTTDLHTLSQVDRWWASIVHSYFSRTGSASLFERRALSQLAKAKQSSIPVRSLYVLDEPPRSAAPRGRLSEIVQLLGSPPIEGKGGSGILGLPPELGDPALAVLTALAGSDGNYWLMVCVNFLRIDPSQPVAKAIRSIADPSLSTMEVVLPYCTDGLIKGQPIRRMGMVLGPVASGEEIKALCRRPGASTSAHAPLAVVLCEMATCVSSPGDIQGLVGRAADADGYGGIGILALPSDLQVYPLRVLNLAIRENRSGNLDSPAVFDMVAEATASNGDVRAMGYLCKAGIHRRDGVSIKSLRSVWSAVCTPNTAHVTSLKALLGSVSKFSADERAARFEEYLSAWESLLNKDPVPLLLDPFELGEWFGRGSNVDDGLMQALESLPKTLHEQGMSRICELRRTVWSTVCSSPDFKWARALKAILPSLSQFPVAERVERFEQNLSAWETLASKDAAQLGREFRPVWSGQFGDVPRADDALRNALHQALPDALHENFERRILALRLKVDAAQTAPY